MAVLLIATIVLPIVGAIACIGLCKADNASLGETRPRDLPSPAPSGRGAGGEGPRLCALVTALVTLGMAIALVVCYPGGTAPFAEVDLAWVGGGHSPLDIRLSLGLDGLSVWLFGLTALLTVVAVLVSWEAISQQTSTFYGLLLLLETGLLGVFAARDVILFFLFFELTLVPLFFLIGIWGSENRRHAAIKFFLFTMTGSVLMFLGLLAVVLWDCQHAPTGRMTFSIAKLTADLAQHPMPSAVQTAVFLALFAGFAIKVPLFPLHTWLPLAHVEAPTAGSVVLAGVLLKVGAYGFVRFALPMTPDAVVLFMPWLLWLAVIGILYGALVALAQGDIKRLIAYSSVSHLGFCMLGVFALDRLGMQGGVLQMVNHGLATGGLFALVGMLYERFHTRRIADYGGLAQKMPRLAALMLIFTLSSIGLPGLNGFVGEFLVLLGMFQRGWADAPPVIAGQLRVIAVLAVSGVVLGAWYMLQMVQRVFYGPLQLPAMHDGHGEEHRTVNDLSRREVLALAPLVVFIFWIGIQPGLFLDRMGPTLDQLLVPATQAYATRYPPATRTGVATSLWHGRETVPQDATVQKHALATDPCQLVWQVNEIGWLTHLLPILEDPCRLDRQVNQTPRLRSKQSPSPAGQAGRGRRPITLGSQLAVGLLHLPDELAGVVRNTIPGDSPRAH